MKSEDLSQFLSWSISNLGSQVCDTITYVCSTLIMIKHLIYVPT